MKFFLDQNVSQAALDPLRALYLDHEFRHAYDEGLSSEDDIPLFSKLCNQGYDAIVTKDRNQLRDEDERRALFDSGLHWIGHRSKEHKGLMGIVIETSTVTAGLMYVLQNWKDSPHSYLLYGITTELGQRVKISTVGEVTWGRPKASGLGLA